ncbi:MAG: DUF5685 family protein [Clostridia bacterium]|jgi:hypothetical protein
MFGYIYPDKPELKIKDYHLFRAYYCGMCKNIGERYGQMQRMLLNYDTTFLGLFLSSMVEERETVSRERCVAHPLQKKAVIRSNPFLDYSTDIHILLAYHKLIDDWRDDKSPLALAGMAFLRKAYQKAKKRAPLQGKFIQERLRELNWLEKQRCCSVDQIADVFGRLVKDTILFSPIDWTQKQRKLMGWMGYNLGRWIYIMDAYDDLERDSRKKNYNVLLLQYEYKGEEIPSFKERIREPVEFNLVHTLAQISQSFELMELKKYRDLVENIICMGMYKKTQQVISGRSCKADGQPLSSSGCQGRGFRGGDSKGISGVGQEISS